MSEDDDKTRILRGRPDDEALTRVLPGARVATAADDDDGGRTRILAQAPGVESRPGQVVAPAGKPGDRIVFQCPNGHRIVVGKQFAGKRGKCNKCGADVHIPHASGSAAASPPLVTIAPPEAEEAEDGASSDGEEAPSLDALAFGDLAAKPATAAEDFEDIGIEASSGSTDHDDAPEWNFEAGSASASDGNSAWSSSGHGPAFDSDESNPTARLVARLWLEREHGGIVELHLDNGAIILPEWYESNWSKGTHGLFASQAPDGSITLTAVAWESVQKVVVRQLAAVPDDMFT